MNDMRRIGWAQPCFAFVMLAMFSPVARAAGDEDVADVPSKEMTVGGNDKQRYFLLGPLANEPAPAAGFGLVVVLPGGDGGAEFLPFVKRLYKFAMPKGYLVAEPVAVKWTPQQAIVWPTAKNRVADQAFTTEDFVDAVFSEVGRAHKLDPKRMLVLGWSSGGPAAYAVALRAKTPVVGAYIAMSVFKPSQLPSVAAAKGRSFVIDHSQEDKVCPFRMAEQARDALSRAGARVQLVTYRGGHGWRGDVFGRVGIGMRYLQGGEWAAPEKQQPSRP